MKNKRIEIENPTQLTQESTSFPALGTLKEILSTKTVKNLDFPADREFQGKKKFRFSRNNFLSLNSSQSLIKDPGILNKIDAAISAFTSKNNSEVKNSMKIIDRLENKGFKLNPLIYLSNNEQNLLEEITLQYERMVKENNQSRSSY